MKPGYYINSIKCSFCGSKHTQHRGDDKRFFRFCLTCGGREIKGATIKGELNNFYKLIK